MSNDRDSHDTGKTRDQDAAGMDEKQRAGLRSREGDPRKRDQQDVRTTGSGSERDRPKDDPSRAPESGTP